MKQFMRPCVLALALSLSPLAVMAGEPIDINTATAAQLQQIKGIGPAKAQAIIDYRTKHGPFQQVDDLAKVDGIGPKLLEKIRPEVTVKGAPGAKK